MIDLEMADRETATGVVGLVQAYVNTVDVQDGPEQLSDPNTLNAWLVAHELMESGQTVTEADLRHAIAVREAGGVAGAMGRMVAALFAAVGDADWSRLKLCGSQRCRWAFYDRSRNHSSRWCT